MNNRMFKNKIVIIFWDLFVSNEMKRLFCDTFVVFLLLFRRKKFFKTISA